MSAESSEQAQQGQSGFFGRIWGKGEPKKKAVKANLGEKNQLFYNEELKRWMRHGEEVSAADLEPPPPPTTKAGFAIQPSLDAGPKRAPSRYADAGGFGKLQATGPAATAPFLPRPGAAPVTKAPFLPEQAAGAAGAPRFFVPGAAAGSGAAAFTPAWAGGARSAGGGSSSTPTAGAPAAEQMAAADPPERKGKSPASGVLDGDDSLSWSQWREQDEERRESERQEAAKLGAQVFDSFTATATEWQEDVSASMDASGAEAGPASEDRVEAWPQGLPAEESVGDNMSKEASFGGWAHGASDEAAVTSPSRPQPQFSPIPEAAAAAADDGFGAESGYQATAGDDFFGGTSAAEEASAATLGDWNPADGGEAEAMSAEQPLLTEGTEGQWEQTYGGLTWSQLQEWAEYYKQQGTPDDEVQAWVDGYLANPDPQGSQAAPEAAAGASDGYADDAGAPDGYGDNGLLMDDPAAVPEQQQAGPSAVQLAHGDDASLGLTTGPHGHDIGLEYDEAGAQSANGDLMSQLREYVKAERATNPNFGKLTRPLPWEGVLTSDDESLASPTLRLSSEKKRRKGGGPGSPAADSPPPAPAAAAPTIAQVRGFVDSLAGSATNALGASWLDKIRRNLAEGQATEERGAEAAAGEPPMALKFGPGGGLANAGPRTSRRAPENAAVSPIRGREQRHAATAQPRAELAEGPAAGISQGSTPRAGGSGPRHAPPATPKSSRSRSPQLGLFSNGPSAAHPGAGTPRQGFAADDVFSLASSPASAKSATGMGIRLRHDQSGSGRGRSVPSSPLAGSHAPENGHSSSSGRARVSPRSARVADASSAEAARQASFGPMGSAENEGWHAEGWENGGDLQSPVDDASKAASAATVVDSLAHETQHLPPLNIKPPVVAEAALPVTSSKALVAEVEELRRQLIAATTERDRLDNDLTIAQDQHGKLEIELSDLKTSIDERVTQAVSRANSKALQEFGAASSMELDAGRASLAMATAEVESLRAALESERRAAAEQRAAFEVSGAASSSDAAAEAAQLVAEREELIQESERLLADREECEAERDALAAEREAFAAEARELGQQRQALQAEHERLAGEAAELEEQRSRLEGNDARIAQDDPEEGRIQALEEAIAGLTSELASVSAARRAMERENEGLGGELLAKDEEIEQLTGSVVALGRELEASRAAGAAALTADEERQLREQADLDFHRIAVLDQQNQELQERIDELEEAAEGAGTTALEALTQERDALKEALAVAIGQANSSHGEVKALKAELQAVEARTAGAASSARAVEEEREAAAQQIEALTAARDTAVREAGLLKKRAARAEARANRLAKAAEEVEELRQKLAAAEEAAASGAEAVAEKDDLAGRLASALTKTTALEADLAAAVSAQDDLSEEVDSLKDALAAAQKAAAAGSDNLKAEKRRAESALSEQQHAAQAVESGLRDELTAACSLKAAAEERVTKLREEVAGLQRQLEQAAAEEANGQERLAELRAETAEASRLAAELSRAEAECAELVEAAEARDADLADAVALAKAAAAERDGLAEQAAAGLEAQREVERLRTELEAARASAEGGASDAEQRLAGLASRAQELEEENEELFSRMSAMEEEADERAGKLHAAQERLAAAERRLGESPQADSRLEAAESELATVRSRVQSLEAQLETAALENGALQQKLEAAVQELGAATSRLSESAAQLAHSPREEPPDVQAALAEKEQDLADLMVCLGQETAKVDALAGLLSERGVAVQDLLDQVEASYGYGEEASGVAAPTDTLGGAREPAQAAAGGAAADLGWLENPLEDAEGDWGF